MPRTAAALSISTSPDERRLIDEYQALTGESPTRLVRQLVFARLAHIVSALKELEAAGIDVRAVPDLDLRSPASSPAEVRAFYQERGDSWTEG